MYFALDETENEHQVSGCSGEWMKDDADISLSHPTDFLLSQPVVNGAEDSLFGCFLMSLQRVVWDDSQAARYCLRNERKITFTCSSFSAKNWRWKMKINHNELGIISIQLLWTVRARVRASHNSKMSGERFGGDEECWVLKTINSFTEWKSSENYTNWVN